MKTINIYLDDKEHAELSKMKGDRTWTTMLRYGCKKYRCKEVKK